VLGSCLDGLGKLHDALDMAEQRTRPACRTLVRDGGSWSEQLELDLDVAGYFTLISLPLSHRASEVALKHAARRGAMKPLGGTLGEVRAARLRTSVGELDRTLVVVESQELLRGQKRGIAAALLKAKEELRKLERQAASGRIKREALESRVQKALRREHLAEFVVAEIKERGGRLSLDWHVDVVRRRGPCLPTHGRGYRHHLSQLVRGIVGTMLLDEAQRDAQHHHDGDHDGGRGRDHASRRGEPVGYRGGVVATDEVLLADS